jgi:hypothetical protein
MPETNTTHNTLPKLLSTSTDTNPYSYQCPPHSINATTTPPTASTTPPSNVAAAPVNCAGIPVPVALEALFPLAVDILTMTGLVAFPAAQEGTATAERVTMTSAGAADGQPGVIVMVDVGAEDCLIGGSA